MNINPTHQAHYFDIAKHRYTHDLTHPPFAQLIEYSDLFSQLKIKPPATIIDFGCGSGRLTIPLVKRGFDVIAIDISRQSLADLQIFYKKYHQPSWGKLITRSTLPTKPVDGIVGADVLHHVVILHTLPLFFRILKRGGRIAFSEPNALHIPWYFHYALDGIPFAIEKGIFQCTYANLHRILIHAGFIDVQVKGHGLIPTPLLLPFGGLAKINAFMLGNLPILRHIAFRYVISAMKEL